MRVLRPAEKTALLFPVDAVATGQPAVPAIDAEVKATGRTRDIEGVACTEFAVMMKVDMAAMAAGAGSSLPPEAAALLKDVFLRVEGSTWVARDAPGATDYAVFQKAAARAAIRRCRACRPAAAASRPSRAGWSACSPASGGDRHSLFDRADHRGRRHRAVRRAASGPGADEGRQQGDRRVDRGDLCDTFTVPEGYTVVKQSGIQRITRSSPCRRVTRWPSRYSRSGIANFRDRPVSSLNSRTPGRGLVGFKRRTLPISAAIPPHPRRHRPPPSRRRARPRAGG